MMKRELLFSVLFCFIFFIALSSLTGQMTEEEKKSEAFATAYPDTSKSYRGVVAIDAQGSGSDALVCDFGSNGLWYYKGSWTKLNAGNPDFILGFQYGGTNYVLCDFGSSGLWYWRFNVGLPGQFIKISSANVANAFVTDDDNDGSDEIHLFFGANGLWRYDMGNATKLTKLHMTQPSFSGSLRSDLWISGWEEGAHDFGSSGLWTYDGSWYKISANSPSSDNVSAEIGNGDTAEELICDYTTNGVWLYDGSTWHKISSSDLYDMIPVRFEGAPDYELLATFNTPGLWMWNYTGYPGSWTQISANNPDSDDGFCEAYDPNGNSEASGDQEVAVDFDTSGLWQYDYTGSSWTKLNGNNPEFMIGCEYWNDGYNTALVVDFGPTVGLWIWDGRYSWWNKLSSFSPDGISD
jgi:hypothetical protein